MHLSTTKKTIVFTRFPFESQLSGEEWHTIDLAESLRNRGHTVIFLGSCPILSKEFKKRGFPTYYLWAGKLPVSKEALIKFFFQWPSIQSKLQKKIKEIDVKYGIDSLYMLSLTEKLLLTSYARKRKWHITWVEHQRIGKWLLWNPFRPIYEYLSKYAQVVAVSPMNGELLKQLHIPKDNLHVITNGVNTTIFTPNVEPLPLTSNKIHIGTVARFYHDKGLDTLLEAFHALIDNTTKSLHLHICGEGPEENILKDYIQAHGLQKHVTIHTPIVHNDIAGYYKALDIFVLPSRYHDPFGLVVAEALLVGTPTIVTNVCGITSHLRNTLHALVIEPENSKQLSHAMKKLVESAELRETLSQEGQAHAQKTFSLDRMVDEYEKLL